MLYEGGGERGGCQTLNNEREREDIVIQGGPPADEKSIRDCYIRAVSDFVDRQLSSTANFKRGEVINPNCSFYKVFPFFLALAFSNVTH